MTFLANRFSQSIQALMNDFQGPRYQYKGAHVFLTEGTSVFVSKIFSLS